MTVKVGDKIRIVDEYGTAGRYSVGDILTVKSVDSDGDVRVKEFDKPIIVSDEFEVIPDRPENDDKLAELELRIATLEASVQQSKATAEESQPLKVGDYARVIGDVDEYKSGDIIEITGGESPSGYYELTVEKVLENNHRGFIDKKHVVPITDEEVAEAKRQAEKDEADRSREAAIAAKFAEIGRKPGEFKAGDIVKVVRHTTGHYTGTIGEVVDDEETDYPLVRARYADGDVMDLYSWSEIITPVERRFDR